MKTLETEQLQELWGDNPDLKVINVLSSEAFNKEHIPNTINVPRETEEFEQKVEAKIGGKDKPVVVYCASQSCDASPKAAERLEQAGFETVYDYEGGTAEWKKAGLPLGSLN